MTNIKLFKCGVFLAALLLSAKMAPTAFAQCSDDGAGNIICDNQSDAPYYQTDTLNGDSLTKTGTGSVVLAGGATVNNQIDISEGTLVISDSAAPTGNFALNLTGALQTSGDISLNNNTTTNNGSLNIEGEDSTLTLSGSLTGNTLNKNGAGILNLHTTNTYTGVLNINEGDVSLSSASFNGNAVLADEAAIIFNQAVSGNFTGSITGGSLFKTGSEVLEINGQNTADTIINEGAITINSADAMQGNITLDGGSLAVTGNMTLGTNAQEIMLAGTSADEGFIINSSSTLTLAGNTSLTGGGNLVKSGAGSLILGGAASAFTGEVYVNGGTLSAAEGVLLGTGAAQVNLNGGILGFTGTTALDKNINVLDAASALDIANGKTLTLKGTVTGSETLVKSGAGELKLTVASQNTGGIQVDGGILSGTGAALSGNIANHAQINFDEAEEGIFTGNITGGGSLVKNGAGNLTLNGTIVSGGITINEGSLTGNTLALSSDIDMKAGTGVNFAQDISGAYSGILSGSGNIKVTGAGAVYMTAENTYSGTTSITEGGTLIISSSGALGTSSLTVSGGTLSAADNLTLGGFTLGEGVNHISVAANKTLTTGGLTGTSFVKSGSGDLYLNAANNHTGGTQVSQGGLVIDNEDALGEGIFALTGGTLKNNNDLSIERNIYLDGALSGFEVKAGTSLTANGILYGDGTLNKSGDGTLLLTSANIYTGGINITGGILEGDTQSVKGDINMSGGSKLIFNQSFNSYFDRNIITSAADTIAKSGIGILMLQGNNTIGTLNAAEGVLIYSGNLNGNVLVDNGAEFMAAGTFNGDITTYGSFIAQDGEAVNITGALNVKNGGTIEFAVNEGEALIASADQLDIETGAKLDIYAYGVFAAPQSFDLLDSNGITGAFDTVTVANNRRLTADVNYDGGMLSVQINRLLSNFHTVGAKTVSQKAFAAAVDRASAAPSTDFELFLNTVEDSSDRAALLNQSGGFIYANAFNATIFDDVVNNAYMRLYKEPDTRNSIQDNIWVQSVNSYGRTSANENSAEITKLSNGFNIGLDNYYDTFNFGYYAAYARHYLKHNGTEKAEGDEYLLGAYLTAQGALWDFKGIFALVYNDLNFTRNISFIGRTAQARGKAYGIDLDLEQGLNIGKIRPFVALRGRYLNRQGISESGADSINLNFSSDNAFAAYARAGIGFAQYGKIDFYGDIALRQVLYEPSAVLSIFGQDYTIDAADVKTFGEVNLGLQKRFSELLSVFGTAGFKFASKAAQGNLNIGIRSYF